MLRSNFTRKTACLVLLVTAFLSTSCANSRVEPARIALPGQDATNHLAAAWICQPELQNKFTARMTKEYFRCWNAPEPEIGFAALQNDLFKAKDDPGYGENLLPRSRPWAKKLVANSNFASYPNQAWAGLTLDWLDLRVLPTARPSLYGTELPGAMTFDRLQQSLLPPNMPVWVHHVSSDQAWLYVETPIAWGWLPSRRVARLDADQIRRWQKGPFLIFLEDETVIRNQKGRFLFKADLGCLFPMGEKPGSILTSSADLEGQAVFEPGFPPPEAVTNLPLRLNSENLAMLINRLIESPYGWGGLYGNRDCSATLQDLFRVFGLWLPRNSADQARTGRQVNLEGLDAQMKEDIIRRQGLPGLTILYMPGHVMLYLGSSGQEAIAFHNVWGLRTKSLWSGEGRAILGRGVITNLRPGDDLPHLDRPNGLLVNRIKTMTLLLEKEDFEGK